MLHETHDRIVAAERAPVVQKGHRDEKMAEDEAAHTHEREDPNQRAALIRGGEIEALVPEH